MGKSPSRGSALAQHGVRGQLMARVLIADADGGTLAILGAIMRREGYTVTLATSGAQALNELKTHTFELLVADTMLECEDATFITNAARVAPSVTRIALATYDGVTGALRALREGAHDYLMKPVDVEELRLSIRSALEKRALEAELASRVVELEATHAELTSVNQRLREAVSRATSELRDNVNELEEANERLRETQAQHQRFVQMVAHEMRGPLNPIINYAMLAKRTALSVEKRDEFMDSIVENAQRLNRLVGDLQTATRLSAGQFTLRRDACDIGQLMTDLVADFTATVKERTFVLTRPQEPVVVDVDQDRIQQAARNLLDNAVKYSAPEGSITAQVWRDEQFAYISVSDDGAGIPEDQMKRIFEPFIRLEKHASDVSGSGLGLFITRGIAEAHGGDLVVRNRGAGRVEGAVFTLRLPLVTHDNP